MSDLSGFVLNRSKQMQMTLFVDASFCPRTKAAGWGAWAKSDRYDRGHYFGSMITIGNPQTPSHAELMGIAEACRLLDMHDEIKPLTHVVLQCDSLDALQFILRFVPTANAAKKKHNGTMVQWMHYLKIPPKLAPSIVVLQKVFETTPVWLRHVKGHENGIHGRSHVNETCDKIAKRHMHEERKRRDEAGSEQR